MREPATFGAELEWADVDRDVALPGGSTWNTLDYTIVNSSGIANDPKGLAYRWGGEINTAPVSSPIELAYQHEALAKLLDPTINYRCNLHIHVRIPGLEEDLELLKEFARRFRAEREIIWTDLEPIPMPHQEAETFERLFGERPSLTWPRAATKRYQRRRVSHHYLIPEARHQARMQATTPEEFHLAEPPRNHKTGKPMWHLSPREAMNLRQVFEATNTIEFRHFPGARSSEELYYAARWVEGFCKSVILGLRVNYEDVRYPTFLPTSDQLEEGWNYTNFGHGRSRALSRIARVIGSREEDRNARPVRLYGQQVSLSGS